jgi:hypothetical protein
MLRNTDFPDCEIKVWARCAAGAPDFADQRAPPPRRASGSMGLRARAALDEAIAVINPKHITIPDMAIPPSGPGRPSWRTSTCGAPPRAGNETDGEDRYASEGELPAIQMNRLHRIAKSRNPQ